MLSKLNSFVKKNFPEIHDRWSSESIQEQLVTICKHSVKKKDPNAPKKPASAYIIFCKDHIKVMKKADKEGKSSPQDIIKQVSKKWNELKQSNKKADKKTLNSYITAAKKDKVRYEKELKKYNNSEEPKTKKPTKVSKKTDSKKTSE